MKKVAIILSLIFLVIVLMPMFLHPNIYAYINDDTIRHLEAFKVMEVNGYNGLYLGQELVGWVLNNIHSITGISVDYLFMFVNFIALALAGLLVGYMMKRLTGNTLVALISPWFIVFGVGATLHLFFSGTIFNIIGVLILIPAVVIITHYLYDKKRYILTMVTAFVLLSLIAPFHPSMGTGLLLQGELQEAMINPAESIVMFFGITNMLLALACGILFIKSKLKLNAYQLTVFAVFILMFTSSNIIGQFGLTPFPSRVLINTCLFAGIILLMIAGWLLQYRNNFRLNLAFTGVCLISILPSFFYWIINVIIKGVTASDIMA